MISPVGSIGFSKETTYGIHITLFILNVYMIGAMGYAYGIHQPEAPPYTNGIQYVLPVVILVVTCVVATYELILILLTAGNVQVPPKIRIGLDMGVILPGYVTCLIYIGLMQTFSFVLNPYQNGACLLDTNCMQVWKLVAIMQVTVLISLLISFILVLVDLGFSLMHLYRRRVLSNKEQPEEPLVAPFQPPLSVEEVVTPFREKEPVAPPLVDRKDRNLASSSVTTSAPGLASGSKIGTSSTSTYPTWQPSVTAASEQVITPFLATDSSPQPGRKGTGAQNQDSSPPGYTT